MCNYFEFGPMDQILVQKFRFLALVVILYGGAEPFERYW